MDFISGLVSISFRSLSPEDIIKLVKECGLRAVEWGGDIHVPAGNVERAKEVRAASDSAGVLLPEYGSYYQIGYSEPAEILKTVACANALQTPMVRLWAADKNYGSMTKIEYKAAVEDAYRICTANPSLLFCLECHNNTLTEDYHTALTYLNDVGCPNLKLFWQPNQFRTHEYNIEACNALLPYVCSTHVFSWEGNMQYPLNKHTERWKDYLDVLKNAPVDHMYLMLEFMHDNQPSSLMRTALTLNEWINTYRSAD